MSDAMACEIPEQFGHFLWRSHDIVFNRVNFAFCIRHPDENGTGPFDLRGVAPDLAAGSIDLRLEGINPRTSIAKPRAPTVPGIGVRHGLAEQLRSAATDHQRRPLRARPARAQFTIPCLVKLPSEVDLPFAQKFA